MSDLARNRVMRIDRRGRMTEFVRLEAPAALALSGTTLYVSSLASFIWRIDVTTRAVTRVAGNGTPESTGDGGPALDAHVKTPHGLALDADGHLYLEGGTAIRRIDAATGTITTFHREGGSPAAFARDGTLYYVQGDPRFGGAVKRRARTAS